jgi:hypothetical protein
MSERASSISLPSWVFVSLPTEFFNPALRRKSYKMLNVLIFLKTRKKKQNHLRFHYDSNPNDTFGGVASFVLAPVLPVWNGEIV